MDRYLLGSLTGRQVQAGETFIYPVSPEERGEDEEGSSRAPGHGKAEEEKEMKKSNTRWRDTDGVQPGVACLPAGLYFTTDPPWRAQVLEKRREQLKKAIGR